MPEQTMRGVFPILITPFDEQARIDEASLRHLVEFNIAAGVHGLGVALGSEVFKLSEAERDQVTRIVVDEVRGRVPVVINTGAAGTDLAVFYSRTAEAERRRRPDDYPSVVHARRRPTRCGILPSDLRAVVHIPIFIQDTPARRSPPG